MRQHGKLIPCPCLGQRPTDSRQNGARQRVPGQRSSDRWLTITVERGLGQRANAADYRVVSIDELLDRILQAVGVSRHRHRRRAPPSSQQIEAQARDGVFDGIGFTGHTQTVDRELRIGCRIADTPGTWWSKRI
ncbi:hypothetical protein D9M71_420680 [compost metagenome]